MGADSGEPPRVVLLTGPTAAGKTDAAVRLARALDGEIVSVDSGLVYRGLDIGTAKPTETERGGVPHHLIDVREPWEPYSAASFVDDALRLIGEIRARGRRPLLVGGTLLYVRALERGLAPLPPADPEVRAGLAAEAALRGWPALHAELARVDPVVAARVHPNDPQRVQRALEVHRLTGVALGDWQRRTEPAFAEPLVKLALVPTSRAWLHERIARRLDAMVGDGFLDEVRRLRADPRVHAALPSMRSVGYRQAWEALERADGARDADASAASDARFAGGPPNAPSRSAPDPDDWLPRARAATRQLAKRQLTWLRGMPDLHVVPCDTLDDDERDRALAAAVTTAAAFPRGASVPPPDVPDPPGAP